MMKIRPISTNIENAAAWVPATALCPKADVDVVIPCLFHGDEINNAAHHDEIELFRRSRDGKNRFIEFRSSHK